MANVRTEAEGKVARLLAMVCNDHTDPKAFEFALKELTKMAILGTLPPGCRE